MATIGLDILAKGGDLEGLAFGQGRDRAMLDPCRNGLEPGRFQSLDHRGRGQGGGQINIVDLAVQDRIAHAAADKAHTVLAALGDQGFQNRLGRGLGHPRLKAQRKAHGLAFLASKWAGPTPPSALGSAGT